MIPKADWMVKGKGEEVELMEYEITGVREHRPGAVVGGEGGAAVRGL